MAPEARLTRAADLARVRVALGVGFPPVRRRAFWTVQALVFVIAGAHTLVETLGDIEFPPPLFLLPTSLFFVPVVYAALRFGARGSVTTALWSIALTLPNIILLHHGLDRAGILWQLAIMLGVALVVGARVDLEREAHAETQAREGELRASEERYRALFDNAAEAVLVLDSERRVEDANDAACRLLGVDHSEVLGSPLEKLAGGRLLPGETAGRGQPIEFPGPQGAPSRWLERVLSSPLPGPDGRSRTQLMLQDVTMRHERQQSLERYARRTVTAREEERRRIGRELHDGPLQNLMLVGHKLDEIDAEPTTEGASGRSGEAREILDAVADEVRRISRALRPSVLDDLGLVAALRSEAASLSRRSGLRVAFAAPASVGVTSEAELMLLRVAQEALHNVERHAGATHVAVRLRLVGEMVCLAIRDDGSGPGILPSAADLLAAGRLGLVGMEERARLVGGDFSIRRGKPRGTFVCVSAPIHPPPAPY